MSTKCPCGRPVVANTPFSWPAAGCLTERWKVPICRSCWEDLGEPGREPRWTAANLVVVRVDQQGCHPETDPTVVVQRVVAFVGLAVDAICTRLPTGRGMAILVPQAMILAERLEAAEKLTELAETLVERGWPPAPSVPLLQ